MNCNRRCCASMRCRARQVNEQNLARCPDDWVLSLELARQIDSGRIEDPDHPRDFHLLDDAVYHRE